ncbi:tripeptide aminopeptidase [Bradyrhizobium sp. GM5.1]
MPVDTKAATDRLLRFLAVEGVTGQEAAIGRELTAALKESGVPAKAIRLDDANTRIPVPTETGNLIVDLPGRGALHNQPRIMFMTHMDTVPLCAGAKPKKSGRKIVNDAKTALGGDNRCGCGVLVTLAAELEKQQLDHPPITLLFCVREESGLYGARHVKLDELGSPVMAFNYDGGSASNVVIGAVGADRWTVEIFGRASHAGVAPERGISSTMILALALADVKAGGWFGKVVKRKQQGTSNVGPVTGGEGRPAGDATNVVTDYVHVRGESRSHDGKFFKEITKAYKAAFEKGGQESHQRARQVRQGQVQGRDRLFPVPHEGQPSRRQTRGGGRVRRRRHPERAHRQWRPRCQLDGPPRRSDRDLRRRPERGAHDRRVDQSRRIRPRLRAGRAARDDAVSCLAWRALAGRCASA